MKDTPYIYHLNTTAYFISSGSAESMSDNQLIHAATSACYSPNLPMFGYTKVSRGQEGTLWRKVSA